MRNGKKDFIYTVNRSVYRNEIELYAQTQSIQAKARTKTACFQLENINGTDSTFFLLCIETLEFQFNNIRKT